MPGAGVISGRFPEFLFRIRNNQSGITKSIGVGIGIGVAVGNREAKSLIDTESDCDPDSDTDPDDTAQAALSGSWAKASGSAGRYLRVP